MTEQERTDFAKLLIEHVRDISIRNCDIALRAENPRSPTSKRYRNAYQEMDMKSFGEMVAADAVDETIFFFMNAIDYNLLKVSYQASDGRYIELTEDIIGELAGWYIGDWRFEHSKERSIDDLPDVGL